MKTRSIADLFKSKGIPFEFYGEPDTEVEGFSSIYKYKEGTLSWIRNKDTFNSHGLSCSGYTCLIVSPEVKDVVSAKALFVVFTDPKEVFFGTLDEFWPARSNVGIDPTAVIEQGAVIGENASIGQYCVISRDTVIGDNCVIGAGTVMVGKVKIGDDCYIGPGVKIGVEGFGFNTKTDTVAHYRHYGGVVIGKGVFIGANCCIARGAIDDTEIGDYVKINNLCHIAHNDVIGTRTVVSAGTTVMGSVHIGSDCWVSTSVIRDQTTVGNQSVVGMGAAVVKDVPDNTTVAGVPAKPIVRHEKM